MSPAAVQRRRAAVLAEMQESEEWLAARVAAKAKRFDLAQVLFGPQLEFARDPDPFATAVCSRRAGKTVGVGAWLLEGPIEKPGAPSLYLTKTRGSAKRILWSTLLSLNDRHGLGYEPNEAELVLKRGGHAVVYLAGVDDKSEIEKARGTGWNRVAVDEAQSLPEYVRDLVEDVLMPSLMDHGGAIRVIGTPAPVPVGYFHDISNSKAWRHYGWTVWDNPHIPEERKRAIFAKVLATRGVAEDHPSIQREWFGRWSLDKSALVLDFDAARNTYAALPTVVPPKWEAVIGVDLGFDDADAIVVLAFHPEVPAAYLVHESVLPKQTVSALAGRVKALVDEHAPTAVVVDTGGLGKKIAQEISQRFSLPVKAAEKQDKLAHLELLNDALRTGRFMVPAGSVFAHDCMLVEWDRDKSVGEKRVISERYHSDVLDAALYAFRESLHWLHEAPPPPPPPPGTPAAYAAEAEAMEAAEMAAHQREQAGLSEHEWWEAA